MLRVRPSSAVLLVVYGATRLCVTNACTLETLIMTPLPRRSILQRRGTLDEACPEYKPTWRTFPLGRCVSRKVDLLSSWRSVFPARRHREMTRSSGVGLRETTTASREGSHAAHVTAIAAD